MSVMLFVYPGIRRPVCPVEEYTTANPERTYSVFTTGSLWLLLKTDKNLKGESIQGLLTCYLIGTPMSSSMIDAGNFSVLIHVLLLE